MALFSHPEILEDIRRGVKLRPTRTIDKSKPMFLEDGEVPKLVVKRYDDDFSGFNEFFPAIPTATHFFPTTEKCISNHNRSESNSTPAPIFRFSTGTGTKALSLGAKKTEFVDREKLLHSIKCGTKLRKTITNDRSGLILDDDQKAKVALKTSRPVTPSSLSSLDSHGTSLGQSLSPVDSNSSPSSSSGFDSPAYSIGNAASPSSLLCASFNGDAGGGGVQKLGGMMRMGSLWIRCDSSENNKNSLASRAVPSTFNNETRLLVPSVVTPSLPLTSSPSDIRLCSSNDKLTEKMDANDKKKCEFFFDEEAQIKQRQTEVAMLAGGGNASERIARFKQLEQNVAVQKPQNHFSTLPRNFHSKDQSKFIKSTTTNTSFSSDFHHQNQVRQKSAPRSLAETNVRQKNDGILKHQIVASSNDFEKGVPAEMPSVREIVRQISKSSTNVNNVGKKEYQSSQSLSQLLNLGGREFTNLSIRHLSSSPVAAATSFAAVQQRPAHDMELKSGSMEKWWQESVSVASTSKQPELQKTRSKSINEKSGGHERRVEKNKMFPQKNENLVFLRSASRAESGGVTTTAPASTNAGFVRAFPARVVGNSGQSFERIRQSFNDGSRTSLDAASRSSTPTGSIWTLNNANRWIRKSSSELKSQRLNGDGGEVWRCSSEKREVRPRPESAKWIHSPIVVGEQQKMTPFRNKFAVTRSDFSAEENDNNFGQIIRC